MKRTLIGAVVVYFLLALLGHAMEKTGARHCGCADDCWCKQSPFSFFRWVFPVGHKPQ